MGSALPVRDRPRPVALDKEAYDQYKIARRLGEAISGWDDPEVVPAGRAAHMRGDDYVIGLVFRGRARAYPLWVIDNYHVVNDRIGGERFFVTSCERCQSGSAFVAEVEGNPERDPLFRAVGFQNATLLLKDLRSGSHWIHYEGVGLDRRAAGRALPWIPTYHMEWSDWVALHPDTEVMVPPEDPRHPDARHGHGREEIFARPGMDPAFVPTIVGPLDRTFPENEVVLGLGGGGEWAAYPLREVQREGGVVHDVVGGSPVVVFGGPRPDGFTLSAFVPRAGGLDLTFDRAEGRFRDRQTGTGWTIEGVAVEGPLRGSSLEPVAWFFVRWHAWIYFHRDTRLFRSTRARPAVEPGRPVPGLEEFEPVLSALVAGGHHVEVGEPPVSQRRPRQSLRSATVYVDGDRVRLHRFESETAARDFAALDASWSGLPYRPRSHEGRTRRVGTVVLESDPEERFDDPANLVPLPASEIRWAPVLSSPVLDRLAAEAERPGSGGGGAGFVQVIRALRLSGFEVLEVGFLPPGQLRVGAVNGIALTIEGERFLLYRFAGPEEAGAYAAAEAHTLAFGPYVLRSTPDTMYVHQPTEVLYVGDDTIRWSRLLEDPALRSAVEGVVVHGD